MRLKVSIENVHWFNTEAKRRDQKEQNNRFSSLAEVRD
jgi:hypothetical protein